MPTTILLLMILISGLSATKDAFCQESTRTEASPASSRKKTVFIPQFGVWVSTQEPNNRRQQAGNRPITPEAVNTNEESVTDAILEIRQRLGGGITSHLGEIVPHSDADRMFRAEIEQIKMFHPASTSPRSFKKAETQVADGENIESIRLVAKQLDDLACQLEDLGRYQSADALRVEAQKIRMSVR